MSYFDVLEIIKEDLSVNGFEARRGFSDYIVDIGVIQCECCKQYGYLGGDIATSGGIIGEPTVCEECFENSNSKLAEEAREAVRLNNEE